ASYAGHKVAPETYTITLTYGAESQSTTATILPNPNLDLDATDFEAYHELMNAMEQRVTAMHTLVNQLKTAEEEIASLLPKLKAKNATALVEQGEALINDLNAWDSKMVQRKSKAYDDVENFENKFSANYMFVMNQTDSDIPRVNASNKAEFDRMNQEWESLKAEGLNLLESRIPNYNTALWQAGIGAIPTAE
ncbi:MAG: glycosyl hydrolase, partial [Bacteroidota bacterium]|nr:glycosyl hydrolase [Bacteroidota bacterium]